MAQAVKPGMIQRQMNLLLSLLHDTKKNKIQQTCNNTMLNRSTKHYKPCKSHYRNKIYCCTWYVVYR